MRLPKSLQRLFGGGSAAEPESAEALLLRLGRQDRFGVGDLRDIDRVLHTRQRAGEHERALAFGREALALSTTRIHPAVTVWQINRISLLVAKCESLAAAERFHLQEMQRVRRVPDSDAAVAVLSLGLGKLRAWAGDFAGAREAWTLAEDPISSTSPYRATEVEDGSDTIFALCAMESRLERHDEAARLLRRIESSMQIVTPMLALLRGVLARNRGDVRAAEAEFAAAGTGFDAARVPAAHTHRAALAHARARLFIDELRWGEAERFALDALLAHAEREGDDAEVLVPVLADLARVWCGRRELDDACRASARALAIARHWRTDAVDFAAAEVAHAEARLGTEPDEAAACLRSAEARLARGMPPTHRSRRHIATLLERLQPPRA